jgi:GntR family transcriptional regulator
VDAARATPAAPAAPGDRKVGGLPVAQPLYLQVRDHLVQRVLAGDWRPGDCLPSELKLAEEYGLSQGTIRRAIDELTMAGLVNRQSGRGTFVASHAGKYMPYRFSRFVAASGEQIAGGEVDYLSSGKVPASARVAAGLGIAAGDDVARIVRTRYHDGRRVLLDFMFLGTVSCPGVEQVVAERKPSSLYLVLEQVYNHLIVRVDEHLRARIASDEEAAVLALPAGQPVLEIERTAYSLGGERIEWRISVCDTDRLHYLNLAT